MISVLLAGCLSVFVWGLSQTRPTAQPITYSDRAVRSLEPQPGVLALRQERIGVTLAVDTAAAPSRRPDRGLAVVYPAE